jgi:DNA repair exonuclease SbcCD ATPase subunit
MTPDPIKQKLNDLDTKLSKLTALFFSYHLATMKYLKDKGIADPEEFEKYLAEAKKEFKQLDDDVDFWKMMKDLKAWRRR